MRRAVGVVARLARAAMALLVLALLVGRALPDSPPVTMARQDVGPAGGSSDGGGPPVAAQVPPGVTPTVEPPPLDVPPLVGPPLVGPPDAPPAELFPPALSTPMPPPLGPRVEAPAVVRGTVVVPGAAGRPVLQCPDPVEPVAPLPLLSTPTAIPLYQPIPRLTGELVVVANTNGQGAPLRVAPRPLARELRTVPEYDPANPEHDASNPDNDVVLAVVGSDLKFNRVNWAYVRDNQGNVGWVASHLLTTVARGPGVSVLDPALRTVATCTTATPTPTAFPSIPLVVTPTPQP